jgi:hypothetical protein
MIYYLKPSTAEIIKYMLSSIGGFHSGVSSVINNYHFFLISSARNLAKTEGINASKRSHYYS